jgi:hypothetical protein
LGIIGLTRAEAEALHSQATRTEPLDMTCPHRGERVGEIRCSGCADKKTLLFVFACDLHGKCLLGTMLEGVRGCDGCDDLPAAIQARSVTIP